MWISKLQYRLRPVMEMNLVIKIKFNRSYCLETSTLMVILLISHFFATIVRFAKYGFRFRKLHRKSFSLNKEFRPGS